MDIITVISLVGVVLVVFLVVLKNRSQTERRTMVNTLYTNGVDPEKVREIVEDKESKDRIENEKHRDNEGLIVKLMLVAAAVTGLVAGFGWVF